MSTTAMGCERETRRILLREQIGEDGRTLLSGIDFIEVRDDDQRSLCVHFFGLPPGHFTPNNIKIEGGRRVRDVRAEQVSPRGHDDNDEDECLLVEVNHAGDFSTYTLRLVADRDGEDWSVPAGIDPRYASAEFSFKACCPIDLDCEEERVCPAPKRAEPEISYLAKDYSSFKQLILDRLALIMPEWHERHAPDVGIALVELLAYVGDHLSYYQDAVATEAYIGT